MASTLGDYKKRLEDMVQRVDMPALDELASKAVPPSSPSRRPMSERVTNISNGTKAEWDEYERQKNIGAELAQLQTQKNKSSMYGSSGGVEDFNITRIPEKPAAYADRTIDDYTPEKKAQFMAEAMGGHNIGVTGLGVDPNLWTEAAIMYSPEGAAKNLTYEQASKVKKKGMQMYEHLSKKFDSEKKIVKEISERQQAEMAAKERAAIEAEDRQIKLGGQRSKVAADYAKLSSERNEAESVRNAYADNKASDDYKLASAVLMNIDVQMMALAENGKAIKDAMDRVEKETGVKAQGVMDKMMPEKPSGGWVQMEGKEKEYIDGKGNVIPKPETVKPPETTQAPESITDAIAKIRKKYKSGAYGTPGPGGEAEKKAGKLIHQIRVGVQGSF